MTNYSKVEVEVQAITDELLEMLSQGLAVPDMHDALGCLGARRHAQGEKALATLRQTHARRLHLDTPA